MISHWYESQLVGVLVGATLGFLFSYLPQKIERRKDQVSLLIALKAEVGTIVDYWRARKPVYERYVDTLRKKGPCSIYYSNERAPDIVFQNNAGNLILLPDDLLNSIVEYYAKVGLLYSRMKAMQDVFNRYNAKQDPTLDNAFLIASMEQTNEQIELVITDGATLVMNMRG